MSRKYLEILIKFERIINNFEEGNLCINSREISVVKIGKEGGNVTLNLPVLSLIWHFV